MIINVILRICITSNILPGPLLTVSAVLVRLNSLNFSTDVNPRTKAIILFKGIGIKHICHYISSIIFAHTVTLSYPLAFTRVHIQSSMSA
ncbi:hypothetical protein V1515DRAFT_600336, partial [Lipomyces mesembrius]